MQADGLTRILSDLAKGDLTNIRAELADLTVRVAVAVLIVGVTIVVARLTAGNVGPLDAYTFAAILAERQDPVHCRPSQAD